MTFALMKFIIEQMESRGIEDKADIEAYPTERGYIVTACQFTENGYLNITCKYEDGDLIINETKGV